MKKIIIFSLFLFVLSACSPSQPPINDPSQPPISESEESLPRHDVREKTDEIRTINISAKRWEFSPDTIKVKQGETVKFIIDNTDTTHGMAIPELDLKGIDELTFTPDKTGTFEFRCTTFCGSGHGNMKGTLIIE